MHSTNVIVTKIIVERILLNRFSFLLMARFFQTRSSFLMKHFALSLMLLVIFRLLVLRNEFVGFVVCGPLDGSQHDQIVDFEEFTTFLLYRTEILELETQLSWASQTREMRDLSFEKPKDLLLL